MSSLITLLRQLAGLFVEDGSLAIAILGVVGLAALLAVLVPNPSLVAGAILLFGCLGVLLASVLRAAQQGRAPN